MKLPRKELYGVKEWCMALHGNHDEHQCHLKPGHDKDPEDCVPDAHECYCGVWW